MIRKNEWFISVKLDEIRRGMTTVDKELEEQDAASIDTETEQVDELIGDVNVQITGNDIGHILGCNFVQFCSPLTGNTFQPAKSIDYCV